MHIKDHATAQGWFRKHAAAPSSVGSWKAFVARNNKVQEPRTMAQEPRMGLKPGGLVEPGVTHYATKKPTIVEQIAAEGLLLDKPKYKKALEEALEEVFAMQDKGYGGVRELTQKYKDKFSKKGTLQYGKRIGTDVTTEGKALVYAIRAQVKKLGIDDINTKKMEKALDFYRNKKAINKGDLIKISEKFDVNYNTFSRTLFEKDYRRKIPLKYGSAAEKKKAIAKAYNEAKRIYSNPAYENLIRGTSETQLGHATDLYTQHVTPQDLVYTPAKINQEALKHIDAKHNAIYEKRNKLFKNKPAGWKKEVERLNAKGIELAQQSQGYKNFNVLRADGSTYKFGVDQMKTIDPLNLVGEKKLKNLTEADKSLIELNRKNVFKTQSKIPQKQIEKLLVKIGCGMYAGGRVGFAVGSGKCINRAVAKLKSGNLSTAEKKIVDALGDGLKKGGMPKKFWTTVLKGEGYFALADFANNLTKGQSVDKSFSNAIEAATLGIIDLGGNERDLMKYAEERGLDTKDIKEWMDYAQTYGKYVDTHEDLAEAKAAAAGEDTMFVGPDDDMLVESRIENLPGKIKKIEGQLGEKEKSESIQSGKGYKDMNEMIEGVVAKEWNKPAGVAGLDRGYRKMLGMKGDEGLVWGPIGSAFRESMEKIGFDEHKALKSFTPQTVMNYHPVYGYKEDIKDVIRQGDSPMEDMMHYMKENYPGSGLIQEALREVDKEKEVEKWVDTGFGREKRIVKTDMGSYDYNPALHAGGGIASLIKK